MARSKPTPVSSSIDGLVDWVLHDTNSPHVVVGPTLWQPSDGTDSRVWYFIIAGSEAGRGFRCDQVVVKPSNAQEVDLMRHRVKMTLLQRRPPLVIHDMDDELAMVRLCEVLWPDERITALRQQVEAERQPRGG